MAWFIAFLALVLNYSQPRLLLGLMAQLKFVYYYNRILNLSTLTFIKVSAKKKKKLTQKQKYEKILKFNF